MLAVHLQAQISMCHFHTCKCVHAKIPTTALNAQISFNKQDLFSRCIYLTSINNYKCSYEGIFMIDM